MGSEQSSNGGNDNKLKNEPVSSDELFFDDFDNIASETKSMYCHLDSDFQSCFWHLFAQIFCLMPI